MTSIELRISMVLPSQYSKGIWPNNPIQKKMQQPYHYHYILLNNTSIYNCAWFFLCKMNWFPTHQVKKVKFLVRKNNKNHAKLKIINVIQTISNIYKAILFNITDYYGDKKLNTEDLRETLRPSTLPCTYVSGMNTHPKVKGQ